MSFEFTSGLGDLARQLPECEWTDGEMEGWRAGGAARLSSLRLLTFISLPPTASAIISRGLCRIYISSFQVS